MTTTSRLSASLIFVAIAVFLVSYTWLPAQDRLRREEGKVTNIIPQPNTWYEVEILTSSNARVTCRTRRGGPAVGPNRCPLDRFERYLGQNVVVRHDGRRPYEVTAGDQILLSFSAFRQAQVIAMVLAGLLLTMAYWVWRRR